MIFNTLGLDASLNLDPTKRPTLSRHWILIYHKIQLFSSYQFFTSAFSSLTHSNHGLFFVDIRNALYLDFLYISSISFWHYLHSFVVHFSISKMCDFQFPVPLCFDLCCFWSTCFLSATFAICLCLSPLLYTAEFSDTLSWIPTLKDFYTFFPWWISCWGMIFNQKKNKKIHFTFFLVHFAKPECSDEITPCQIYDFSFSTTRNGWMNFLQKSNLCFHAKICYSYSLRQFSPILCHFKLHRFPSTL